MKNNAVKFNGEHSEIAQEAIAIHQFVRDQIEGNRSELTKLEEQVEDQMSGKSKKRKLDSGGSKNYASLEGVPINLGDLKGYDSGSGDDDDEEEDGDLTSIHDNENVTIDFQADGNGRVPFEVAMVAMRQWLRVREQQRGKWLFAVMDENGEFSDETNAVYEISSAEMFKGKREIVQPTAIITKKSK